MILTRMYISLSIAAMLGACTFQGGLEQSAIDYNRVADRVQKELLLLNVARANRGEGLTYTGISEMRGNFTLNAQGQFTVPFGGAAESNFIFSPSGFYRTNPSIQIRPLSTKEFQRAIASDIAPATFLLLWERGWPKEVLLHLLVEKVVLSIKATIPPDTACPIDGGANWSPAPEADIYVCVFENDPDESTTFRAFQRFLQQAKLRPYTHSIKGKRVGPAVMEKDLWKLKLVAEAHDGELRIQEDPPGQYYLKSAGRKEVRFSPEVGFSIMVGVEEKPVAVGVISRTIDKKDKFDVAPNAEKVTATVHLRSPQGMIYYLGELVRAQKGRTQVAYQRIYGPKACKTDVETTIGHKDASVDPCLVPLFVAWMGEGAAELAVEHRGERYFVPAGKANGRYIAGQSLLVMALVVQLFDMNTSRKDLPATQTVITTGGGS